MSVVRKGRRMVFMNFQRSVLLNSVQKAPSSKFRPWKVDPFNLLTRFQGLVIKDKSHNLPFMKNTSCTKKANRFPLLWERGVASSNASFPTPTQVRSSHSTDSRIPISIKPICILIRNLSMISFSFLFQIVVLCLTLYLGILYIFLSSNCWWL